MKRILLTLGLLSLVLFSVSAEIDLGEFPVGKWLDPNYSAVWEFTSNNIRILDREGDVYYDFSTATIEDLKVGAGMEGLELSFYCPESMKTYIFIKGLTGSGLVLKIQRAGKPEYSVDMPKQ